MSKKYGLTRLVLGNPGFLVLNEAEYQRYLEARNALLNSMYIEEKFDLVIGDYLEFEEELLRLGARSLVISRRRKFTTAHSDRRIITRRIANLLSVCRLYIDQSRHHISSIYGSNSDEYSDVCEEQSKQYDNLLGYRLMEAMRNHVQHRGYPIHGVAYSTNRVESQLRYTVNPYILIRFLEDDEEFKKEILEEIRNLGEKIDVKLYIRQYIEGLGSVQSKIREILFPSLPGWDDLLQEMIRRYRGNFGSEVPVGSLGLIIQDEDGQYTETNSVVTEIIDRRKSLEKKNQSLVGLSKRYVSNKVR